MSGSFRHLQMRSSLTAPGMLIDSRYPKKQPVQSFGADLKHGHLEILYNAPEGSVIILKHGVGAFSGR